jgi:hypothetical protein
MTLQRYGIAALALPALFVCYAAVRLAVLAASIN